MNRTGLLVALALALVVGLLFGIYPELDLKFASWFYDETARSFPLKFNTLAAIARDCFQTASETVSLQLDNL